MNIEVTKDIVKILEQSENPHENEYKITTCYFTFDEFTSSFQVKRAIFTILSTNEMYETDIINNQCDIPSEVLVHEYETVKLGVYGYNIGENEELLNRFSPSYAEFIVPTGSYKEGALSPEPITPSQYDLYSQALQEGLQEVDDKLDEVVETVDGKLEEVDDKLEEVDTTVNNKMTEVDDKLDEVDGKINEVDDKIEEVNTAITETNNLNLDVSDKVDGDVTVTLTKKDASTKSVVISDGTSLMFNWDGTKLGVKTDEDSEYVYVDLQGIQGVPGPQGEPFRIKKTYSSVAEMNADFNNMEYGDYVMIASSVEVEDNAKLYARGESQWIFITDFSGATGIRGPVGATPNIQIGSVTSGSAPSVTRTGTDENPVLNFVLQKGDKGDKGNIGDTGNGISSIEKTSTSGLVDTYTITYTNGNTTTFDVSNGNGIDRIEKTATVGNKDTYTIYFTNGSTTTYEVSNGEVTREELEEEVDRLSMIYNAFPTTTGEGEEPSINGTAEVPFKEIGLKGNTSQESTTQSANLFDENYYNNDSLYSINTYKYTKLTRIKQRGTLYFKAQLKPGKNEIGSFYLSLCNKVNPNTRPNNAAWAIYGTIVQDGSPYQNNYATFDETDDLYFTFYPTTVAVNTIFDTYDLLISTDNINYVPFVPNSPSPDYPQDINVVTGDNEVKVEGKNLFDKTVTTFNGYLANDGTETQSANYKTSDYIPIEPNTTYATGVMTNSGSNPSRCYYDENKTFISGEKHFGATTVVGTSPNNAKYMKESIPVVNIDNVMIYKGTTPTTYVPYQSQTYPINLGSMELCKIGNYQDKIDKSKGNNWFDESNMYSGYYEVTPPYNLTSNNVYRTMIIDNLPKGTYTFKTTLNSPSLLRIMYDNETHSIGQNTNTYTFTTTTNGKVMLSFRNQSSSAITETFYTMLNEGSTALPYEPYGKVWYKYGAIGKTEVNLTGNVGSLPNGNKYNTFVPTNKAQIYGNLCYCNKANYNQDNPQDGQFYQNVPNVVYVGNSADTLATLKQKYDGGLLYYPLATPTITPITDTTLIEQLDNLEKAYSYDTQTNISQTNDDLPFVIKLSAIRDLSGIFELIQ